MFFLAIVALIAVVAAAPRYPVPTPAGGRNAVHGWLILPWDQPNPQKATPITAWFVHHTPEYWTDSPHNFQLILGGTLTPLSVAENETNPIDLPYPPAANLLVDEFTFTPPPPFSLNDLLVGKIDQLLGVVYNGSFDTLYERIPIAIARMNIQQMPTAIWLNISSAIPNLPQMRYFSYPRSAKPMANGNAHFYLSHEIHSMNTNPDFDQVIHATIDIGSCICKGCTQQEMLSAIWTPGAEWEILGLANSMSNRLMGSTKQWPVRLEGVIDCQMVVLEEIHCVVGPAFAHRC